jgi:hypothetical protein
MSTAASTTGFVADSEDNQARMQQAVAVQMRDRDAGLMQYFYRSNVVYQRELETVFFKSWLWRDTSARSRNPAISSCTRSPRNR